MKTKLTIGSIIAASLVLTGCSYQGLSKGNPTPQPSATTTVQSTGNVDKELNQLDQDMNTAQKEDVPTVTQKDLGL